MMIVDTGFYENKRVIERYLPDIIDGGKKDLLGFLTAIDSGIKDITYKTVDKRIVFYTYHVGKDNKKHSISLYNESQGTLKSIVIYIFATLVIARNGVMIVD